ncbi:hypothetical protein ACIQPT_05155 [Streptomyces sp. NPDC091289]|uniref:hypothetical protein n=1 Tax=Streptomyces sp. NPDC091289 TaxID=3365989 RepID=UPI0037FFDEF9
MSARWEQTYGQNLERAQGQLHAVGGDGGFRCAGEGPFEQVGHGGGGQGESRAQGRRRAPDARAFRADFGTDTGQGSSLDAALGAAGAVFPSMPEAGETEVVAYFEEHGERLPERVFTTVGDYTGVTIDRDDVRAGGFPGVLIAPA